MGAATSIVVFAIGAILRFATTAHSSSFNSHTVGVILMVVGVVGFLPSLVFWASWGGSGEGDEAAPSTGSQPGPSLKNPRVRHPVKTSPDP